MARIIAARAKDFGVPTIKATQVSCRKRRGSAKQKLRGGKRQLRRCEREALQDFLVVSYIDTVGAQFTVDDYPRPNGDPLIDEWKNGTNFADAGDGKRYEGDRNNDVEVDGFDLTPKVGRIKSRGRSLG
ncbi:MAG: hypothetical protein SFU85_13535 [Candidatus Methylacidiphilales bacterium]|nr:hypothetical protein [Candidatus Methylacidiphilales bacterium]